MTFGLILTTFLNKNKYEFIIIIIIFIILTLTHLFANYFAVKSLQLNILNNEKCNILIKYYYKNKILLTPKQVCKHENVWNIPLFSFILNNKKNKLIN